MAFLQVRDKPSTWFVNDTACCATVRERLDLSADKGLGFLGPCLKWNNYLKPYVLDGWVTSKNRWKSVMTATLIASVAGTGAWFAGLSPILWSAHPMIATSILTVVVCAAVKLSWPSRIARRSTSNVPDTPFGQVKSKE